MHNYAYQYFLCFLERILSRFRGCKVVILVRITYYQVVTMANHGAIPKALEIFKRGLRFLELGQPDQNRKTGLKILSKKYFWVVMDA